MSTFTVTVVHTIDPAALDILRGLLALITPKPEAAAPAPPPAPAPQPVQAPPAAQPTAAPGPAAVAQPSAPVAPPPVASPSITPVPTAAPVQRAPVQPAPVATAVPTAAPTFTREQISQAAALFADSEANRQVVCNLIQQYGAPSIADLPGDRLGAFATDLRALGVRI